MTRLQGAGPVSQARSVRSLVPPEECGTPRLIVGDPVMHAVAELAADDIGELGEFRDGVAMTPAAPLLQTLRQIPVIQRRPGLEPAGEHSIDESGIEIEALGIGCARAVGQDAR